MSKLDRIEKKCAVCGNKQTVTVAMGSNASGATDLDGRPPMMMRALLGCSVQTCECCHYSSDDVSRRIMGFRRSMLGRDGYVTVLEREDVSPLAKSFLLAALLYSWCGAYRSAGTMFLKAAWVFDDRRQGDYAKLARLASIKYYGKLTASRNPTHEVIKVDIMRRSGDFDGAAAYAADLLDGGVAPKLAGVLRLQIKLAEAHDDTCHTADEAK